MTVNTNDDISTSRGLMIIMTIYVTLIKVKQ